MATYALADIHGQLGLWNQVKQVLEPEDTLVFLGDAIDRGEFGITIAIELLERPNTIYLLGNHEQMMLEALPYIETDPSAFTPEEYIWSENGGYKTLKEYQQLPKEKQKWLKEKFSNLKKAYIHHTEEKSILCCHSGIILDVWDRTHYLKEEEVPKDCFIVHGHTPIPYIAKHYKKYSTAPFWYNNNQKCDIDCASYISGKICLLNLDTFEPIVFSVKPPESF